MQIFKICFAIDQNNSSTNTIIYVRKAGSIKYQIRIHVSFVGKLKEYLEIKAKIVHTILSYNIEKNKNKRTVH